MTPAITLAKHSNINYAIHEYQHDSSSASYGLEAAEKLAVTADRVFKTLVVSDDKQRLAVAILPVNKTLNLKKMAKAINAKKTSMAAANIVEKSTGYVLGGVSPLGQKKRLITIIDSSAENQTSIYVSAGKRGLEIELAAADLASLLSAKFCAIVND